MVKTKDELERKLKSFIELIDKDFQLEAVVLFGSYAGNNPRDYSDIDIAVFSPEFRKNPLDEMTRLCKIRRKIDTDKERNPKRKEDKALNNIVINKTYLHLKKVLKV